MEDAIGHEIGEYKGYQIKGYSCIDMNLKDGI